MKKIFLLIIILGGFSICFSLPCAKPEILYTPQYIRVIVADNMPELILSVKGKYTVTSADRQEPLNYGETFFNLKVVPANSGISFGKDSFNTNSIQITTLHQPSIYLNKRLYRGSLQILKTKEGLLSAINIVDLEDYLKGVLYHEISHRWPMEVIKAQAIVSRTFALYQAQENRERYYYLKADVSSQIYGGADAERYRTNLAVDKTRGMVLVYKGKILPAFFHATCGGKTEDASKLWKVNISPLKGVLCPFCIKSPHFYWRYIIPLSEIEEELRDTDYKLSSINFIEVTKRTKSGRALQLKIKGKKAMVRISAKDFRHILGSCLVRSTNFTISIKNAKAYFKGKGWGHGVGMCQWGAFAMAKKGITAEEILRFYYPGVKLIDTRYSIFDTSGQLER